MLKEYRIFILSLDLSFSPVLYRILYPTFSFTFLAILSLIYSHTTGYLGSNIDMGIIVVKERHFWEQMKFFLNNGRTIWIVQSNWKMNEKQNKTECYKLIKIIFLYQFWSFMNNSQSVWLNKLEKTTVFLFSPVIILKLTFGKTFVIYSERTIWYQHKRRTHKRRTAET